MMVEVLRAAIDLATALCMVYLAWKGRDLTQRSILQDKSLEHLKECMSSLQTTASSGCVDDRITDHDPPWNRGK